MGDDRNGQRDRNLHFPVTAYLPLTREAENMRQCLIKRPERVTSRFFIFGNCGVRYDSWSSGSYLMTKRQETQELKR